MKNYRFLFIGLCLALSSCASITYFGDRLPPTNAVDIYYSDHDVKKDYTVIGHLNLVNEMQVDQEHVKAKLAAYAKKIGADAIVILGTASAEDTVDAIVRADALKYK
ncbi:MAG: hypothetical protein JST32_11975 [Bacteroidetes bacterium]|nr:hypothetical protein [Bacteroidota bacterium]